MYICVRRCTRSVRNRDASGKEVTGESEMDEVRGVIWTNFDPNNNRAKVTAFMGPFFLINIFILLGALTPFQQWCAPPLKVVTWRGAHLLCIGTLSASCRRRATAAIGTWLRIRRSGTITSAIAPVTW